MTCSDDCRRRRKNLKIAEWRQTKDCPPHLHGTLTGYTNYLCDCDACREAEKLYMQEYRKGKQNATN